MEYKKIINNLKEEAG